MNKVSYIKFSGNASPGHGFTLLETLVALALFITFLVPLLERMVTVAEVNKGKDKITASCLLEQEAAYLKMFPGSRRHSIRRKIGGDEWEITIKTEGTTLKKCLITAHLHEKEIDKVIVYTYEPR